MKIGLISVIQKSHGSILASYPTHHQKVELPRQDHIMHLMKFWAVSDGTGNKKYIELYSANERGSARKYRSGQLKEQNNAALR